MTVFNNTMHFLGLQETDNSADSGSTGRQTASDESRGAKTAAGEQSTTDRGPETAGGPAGDDGSTEPETREPLPKDVCFDILKNGRRRMVLKFLLEHENPVRIGTLAEHVAANENDKAVGELNSRERKRAYVGLYQAHLPRMHDAGVIEFNQNRGLVSLGPHAQDVTLYLDDDEPDTMGYPWLHTALSTIGAGAFLISQSGALGARALGSAIVGLVLLTILAVAGYQLYTAHTDE